MLEKGWFWFLSTNIINILNSLVQSLSKILRMSSWPPREIDNGYVFKYKSDRNIMFWESFFMHFCRLSRRAATPRAYLFDTDQIVDKCKLKQHLQEF